MLIEFDPVRSVRTVGKSHYLNANGVNELQLPVNQTVLKRVTTPDGEFVESVDIPLWLATDRGLVDDQEDDSDEVDSGVTRYDYFKAAAITGLCSRDIPTGRTEISDLVHLAERIAAKAVEGYLN